MPDLNPLSISRLLPVLLLTMGISTASLAHAAPKGGEDCKDRVAGLLTADSPTWLRPYASEGAVNLNCSLDATLYPATTWAYANYPVHGGSGDALTVTVDAGGTTLQNTTLYLYCETFDPANATESLVAYSDDIDEGTLSAFPLERNITLDPNKTYWLVLSTFLWNTEFNEGEGGTLGDFGAYSICLGGDYQFGEAGAEGEDTKPFECPASSEFNQPPDETFLATTYSSNTFADTQYYELVTGLDGPVTSLTWWGIASSSILNPCDPASLNYEVTLSQRNGNLPGQEVGLAFAAPTITDTGGTIFGLPLYRFDVAFPEPVALDNGEGFVSIYNDNASNACFFSWLTSDTGDRAQVIFDFDELSYDFPQLADPTICVTTNAACPGQTSETAGTYKVQVIDGLSSFPMSTATVQLIGTEIGAVTGTYDSGGGYYYFDCVPFGLYDLTITAEGYIPVNTNVGYSSSFQFDNFFLTVAEGEPEGCKGCSVITTLFVTVLDQATNLPITNGAVSLEGTLVGTNSNNNGVYVLPFLSDGTYTVLAEAGGYVAGTREVVVNDNAAQGLTVKLAPLGGIDIFTHTGDEDGNGTLSLSELLGVIQLFNSGRYHCDGFGGYLPGNGSNVCDPHSCDFQPEQPDFIISLSELLRGIQIYTVQAYFACEESEDGYCLGTP